MYAEEVPLPGEMAGPTARHDRWRPWIQGVYPALGEVWGVVDFSTAVIFLYAEGLAVYFAFGGPHDEPLSEIYPERQSLVARGDNGTGPPGGHRPNLTRAALGHGSDPAAGEQAQTTDD